MKQKSKARALLGIFVFVAVYIVYLLSMSATTFWQDAGIYLAGIKDLGIIYSPGFPLYVFFGWVWVGLLTLWFGDALTFAQKIHAFSGLWGAGAAIFVGLTVYDMGNLIQLSSDNKDKLKSGGSIIFFASVVAGLASGFSYSLWSQSINAEVYSLAGFFTAVIFWLIVKIVLLVIDGGRKKQVFRWLVLLSVVWGLSFANHPSTIVFFPVLFWLVFRLGFFPWQRKKEYLVGKKKRLGFGWRSWIVFLAFFLISGLLPYIYLPIRSAVEPDYWWSKIDSVESFVNHVTGKVYFTRERAVKLVNMDKLSRYPVLFFQEFFVVGTLFGFYGWWKLLREKYPVKLLGGFGLVFSTVLYLMVSVYERGTEYNLWFIPFYIVFSVFIGIGLLNFFNKRRLNVYMMGFIGLLIVAPQLVVNWQFLNRRSYALPKEFGENLLGKLPGDSILFTIGDQSSAIPRYLQIVEGFRPDIVLIWGDNFLFDWQREHLVKRYPNIVMPEVNDEIIFDDFTEQDRVVREFIYENLKERDIFLITENVIRIPDELFLVPAGTVWKVSENENEVLDFAYWNYQFTDDLRYSQPERSEHSREIKDGMGKVIEVERVKYSDEAKRFELQAKKNLAERCLLFEENGKVLQVRQVDGSAEQWSGKRLLECAAEAYEAMFIVDPDFFHEQIILSTASVFERLGQVDKAKLYYDKANK